MHELDLAQGTQDAYEWHDDAGMRRAELVRSLCDHGVAQSPLVVAALRAVPRHLFLPDTPLERAYADDAVVTKWGDDGQAVSSASQPAMVAIMLEQLAVRPGMRVLEIGAGTGYNAALLAELAGPSGQVTTVDLDADTAARAHDHLRAVGYGPDRVRIVCDDGWHGFASHAPYDRIICTAGVWEVPPAWMAQLAPEGRIVVPLAVQTAQFCLALDRQGESLVSAGMPCCGFMRLRGPFAGPEATLATPAGVRMLADPPTPSPEQLATLLTAPPRPHPLPFAGRIELLRAVLAVLGAHVVSVFGVPAGSCPAGVGILTPDGESACIITAADTCSALCATYGSEAAGEQADACLLRWQALGSSPPERWRCTLVPAELAPSLTETCAIHRKRNWNVVVQL